MHPCAPMDQDLMNTATHWKSFSLTFRHQKIHKGEKLEELVSLVICKSDSLVIYKM